MLCPNDRIYRRRGSPLPFPLPLLLPLLLLVLSFVHSNFRDLIWPCPGRLGQKSLCGRRTLGRGCPHVRACTSWVLMRTNGRTYILKLKRGVAMCAQGQWYVTAGAVCQPKSNSGVWNDEGSSAPSSNRIVKNLHLGKWTRLVGRERACKSHAGDYVILLKLTSAAQRPRPHNSRGFRTCPLDERLCSDSQPMLPPHFLCRCRSWIPGTCFAQQLPCREELRCPGLLLRVWGQ